MASSSEAATASDLGDDQCDVHYQPTIVNDANKAVIIRYLDQMVYDTSVLTALIDRICTLLMQSLSPTHNNYNSASDDASITDSNGDIDVASIDSEQQQQPSVVVEEKIALPEPRPGFSAIGRLIVNVNVCCNTCFLVFQGPRGLTVRQLELDTGCRIAVHGKGSVKDPQRETYLCNRPGWCVYFAAMMMRFDHLGSI
jgi:hypothetical protein